MHPQDEPREAHPQEAIDEKLIENYKDSCDGGILKVMSKMGISTLQTYKGAQIFEALGVDDSVVDRCFTGTATRIRGMTFELIAQDALRFHESGFPSRDIRHDPGSCRVWRVPLA